MRPRRWPAFAPRGRSRHLQTKTRLCSRTPSAREQQLKERSRVGERSTHTQTQTHRHTDTQTARFVCAMCLLAGCELPRVLSVDQQMLLSHHLCRCLLVSLMSSELVQSLEFVTLELLVDPVPGNSISSRCVPLCLCVPLWLWFAPGRSPLLTRSLLCSPLQPPPGYR